MSSRVTAPVRVARHLPGPITTIVSDPAPDPVFVSSSVVVASMLLAASVVPLFVQLPHDGAGAEAALPLLGWIVLGVAGVVLLDRRPTSLVARASVAAAATPTVLLGLGLLWFDGSTSEPELVVAAREWGPASQVVLLLPAAAALVELRSVRSDRRWRAWIVATSVGAGCASAVAWSLGSDATFGTVAAAGIGVVAVAVGASGYVREPRPLIEPLLDVGLVLGAVASAAGAGGVVLRVARQEQIFGAVALSAFATAATLVLALPGAWWLRREFLVRRYGTGILSSDEIAALTADLKFAADPRELLVTAGAMVSATSGVPEAALLLDDAEIPEGWVGRPLLVGKELVGTMLLRPSQPGGLEARQDRVCSQLLPTIALVAQAVSFAVEAAHARNDVAYEREVERARMLADLHDDLGPVLAGMSMRVEAARATHGLPELDLLASDLASCRADLRRIVAGLAPSALDDGDLESAIVRLVESFGVGGEVRVALVGEVPEAVDLRAATVAYRAIAEGLTNAVKHARASTVQVGVECDGGCVSVRVRDDGAGGAIVPGVGLRSLADRAAEVGGTLTVQPVEPSGTELLLVIPGPGAPS